MDHSVLKVLEESRCREASELPLLTCPKLQSHEKEASFAPTWKSNFYLQCLWTGVRRHHRKTFVNSPSLLPVSHPSMPCPSYSCLPLAHTTGLPFLHKFIIPCPNGIETVYSASSGFHSVWRAPWSCKHNIWMTFPVSLSFVNFLEPVKD